MKKAERQHPYLKEALSFTDLQRIQMTITKINESSTITMYAKDCCRDLKDQTRTQIHTVGEKRNSLRTEAGATRHTYSEPSSD